VSDAPDDQAPTDPWGNPLPPDQRPPAEQPGWAQPQQPGYAQPDPAQPPPGAYTPQGWMPQGYDSPQYAGMPKTEGMATGALVCGILSALCGVIGFCGIVIGPIAIILGIVARRRIRESGGLTKGDGLALAGLVLGIIGTVASVGWIIAFATVPELRERLEDLMSTTTTTQG
jgi:hypothetical protein